MIKEQNVQCTNTRPETKTLPQAEGLPAATLKLILCLHGVLFLSLHLHLGAKRSFPHRPSPATSFKYPTPSELSSHLLKLNVIHLSQ